MSEQTDDDDDDMDLERDLAREVEEAFANVPYPGDDKLLRYSFSYENESILEWFRGKHWKEISLQALRVNETNMHRFSPEAFRFYLPCYMVGGLLHPGETNLVWQCVFSNFAPPESEGPDMDWFRAWVSLLDARQKAAVRRYVELYARIEITVPDPCIEQALAFWRRITEPANREIHV